MRITLAVCGLLVACSTKSTPPVAPSAPAGLTATGGAGHVSLSWNAVNGATSYNVLRGDASGQEANPVASAVTNYDDTGLAAGKTYFYVVQAVNSVGTSGNSNEVSATTTSAPPTGLTATAGAGQVALSWSAVTAATGYSVQRATTAGGPYTEVATPTGTSYTDTTVAGGTTYYYVVEGVTPAGHTANSNEASALTAPSSPTGLSVLTSDTGALVTWDAMAGTATYDVQRAPGGTTTFAPVGTTSAPSLSDSGLTPNTSYVYEVRATNATGSSAYATVNATTSPVAPTGLSVVLTSNHHVTLSWTAAAGAGSGGYRVLRGTSASGPFTSAGTTTDTHFTDKFLTNDVAYSYVVHTIGGSGESSDSNVASGTPFIELCALDGAANTISVYDGMASGNVAPKRSFGWQTGIAQASGIGVDGTNVYIASQYSNSINVYPRTVSGNVGPSEVISVPANVTALTVDSTNQEIYAGGADGKVYVYSYLLSPSFSASLARTLTVSNGSTSITGLGLDLTDNQLFVLNFQSIVVYTRTASGLATPANTILPSTSSITAQTPLYGGVYDPFDDAIWVTWDAQVGSGHAASYSRTGSGATASVYTPINATQPVVHGIWLEIATASTSYVWLTAADPSASPHGSEAVYKFARTTGIAKAGIRGSNTRFYQPGPMALDSVNGEFWVINARDGAEAFSSTLADGSVLNSSPVRALDDLGTGLVDPVGIAVDRVNGEIVEIDYGPAQSINVYSTSDSGGGLSPIRTISGPSTGFSGHSLTAPAVDEVNGEYWVGLGQPTLEAFDRTLSGTCTSGVCDGSPLRAITGSNVDMAGAFSIAYDAAAQAIVASAQLPTVDEPGALYEWPRTSDGNAAASAIGSLPVGSTILRSPSVDLAHDLIVALNGNTIDVLPRSFPNGEMSPVSSFNPCTDPAGCFPVVDGEGSEIYIWQGNRIDAYPLSSTGTPSPTRSIAGNATGLFNIANVVICN